MRCFSSLQKWHYLTLSAVAHLAILLQPLHAADLPPLATERITLAPSTGGLCAHQHVLSNIAYNFYHQVRHVPDLPQIRIKGWSNIMVTRFQPALAPYGIARTFCTADAVMNDGHIEPVWYVVEKSSNLSGIDTMNVQFCVNHFDNWHVYNGDCRSLH